MCKIYILFVFTSNFLYKQFPPPVEPVIIEHMISMATTPKTSLDYKLHSFHQKLHIISTLVIT